MLSRSITALALCLCAADGMAESVWVGGASTAVQTRVGYGGIVLPLPGKRLADGWSQSLFATAVRYEYPVNGRNVEGVATGLKYGLMRQLQTSGGMLGVGGGVAWHHTSLSPDDRGNPNRGGRLRGVVELQWRADDTKHWRSQAVSQYVLGERSNFVVASVGRRLASGAAIGPQISSSGDPNYRVYGAALALNAMKVGPAEISLYLGAQHLEGGKTQPEAGLSFVYYRP